MLPANKMCGKTHTGVLMWRKKRMKNNMCSWKSLKKSIMQGQKKVYLQAENTLNQY